VTEVFRDACRARTAGRVQVDGDASGTGRVRLDARYAIRARVWHDRV